MSSPDDDPIPEVEYHVYRLMEGAATGEELIGAALHGLLPIAVYLDGMVVTERFAADFGRRALIAGWMAMTVDTLVAYDRARWRALAARITVRSAVARAYTWSPDGGEPIEFIVSPGESVADALERAKVARMRS